MKCEQVITRSAPRTIRRSTPWMCDCGCLSTQPWWRPYSVACTVTSHGTPAAPRERARRGGDEPVVRVHEVEAAAELDARGQHVLVHVVDPGDERVEVVLREVGLAHAVHDHAVAVLDRRQPPAAAGDDVHLVAVAHELLGQLAHVPREAALDDRRVLPREGQDAHRCWQPTDMRACDRAASPPTRRPSRGSSRRRAHDALPYLPESSTRRGGPRVLRRRVVERGA